MRIFSGILLLSFGFFASKADCCIGCQIFQEDKWEFSLVGENPLSALGAEGTCTLFSKMDKSTLTCGAYRMDFVTGAVKE